MHLKKVTESQALRHSGGCHNLNHHQLKRKGIGNITFYSVEQTSLADDNLYLLINSGLNSNQKLPFQCQKPSRILTNLILTFPQCLQISTEAKINNFFKVYLFIYFIY